jgi:ferric-dicitrate binding protein FerR (iron transport regulator)
MTTSRVRAAAARWLIELESAESIGAIWPQFDAWLREDPEHQKTYIRIERTWRALDGLRTTWPEKKTRAKRRSASRR